MTEPIQTKDWLIFYLMVLFQLVRLYSVEVGTSSSFLCPLLRFKHTT